MISRENLSRIKYQYQGITIMFLLLILIFTACNYQSSPGSEKTLKRGDEWVMGPFYKENEVNPILVPDHESYFPCPVRRVLVRWEEKDVFNPAAIVKKNKIYLLYRAEDRIGKYAGTSRIGLAESMDGINFKKLPQPVLFPSNDFMKIYEWEGGIEDSRIVEDKNGRYIMTYTAYDGNTARLCVAVSSDLFHWEKKGLAFGKALNGKYKDSWSKSGAIVCQKEGDRLKAIKIKGKYWMYWGDVNMNLAISDDLIDWEPLEQENGELLTVFSPRPGKFDSRLVEPGPPAILTGQGIVFIYNSMNLDEGGDPDLPPGTYASGQVLLDANEPEIVLQRTENYFLKPEEPYEITGQVGNVVFLEGLVSFKDKWFLYYGTADSKIAVATYTPN